MFFINATNNTFLTCPLLHPPAKCPITDMLVAGPGRGIYMDGTETQAAEVKTSIVSKVSMSVRHITF